ncbi:MAG: aldehyde dehydrogenase family protein [Rhodospirillaceae bacterium]|nr:aldehyde dehydrogenase family protein [Rhodospirillaceae bacterium]
MVAPIKVRNPRTGKSDYEFTPATAADVARIAARLKANQPRWQALGFDGRAKVLARWAEAIERNQQAITDALVADTGRLTISRNEVSGASKRIRKWCRVAPGYVVEAEQQSAEAPDVRFRPQYVPYPLAGIISPWNFPITLALIDAVPALIAGCAVIIKPSEVTPRFIAPMQAAVEAVPEMAEVLSFVAGGPETGAAIVPNVDIVCLTGSVKTGRIIARQAAEHFIPMFLELGGKDPAVVLPGADLDRAADAILRQSIVNSGQVCLSTERIYVHQSIHDAFVDKLVTKAKAVTINYPDIAQGHLGPIISGAQAEIIDAHLADAVAKGAKVQCGGKVEDHEGGKWCRATVLTNVDHSMALMCEETFGPIMPVMAFKTADEAVALANDSEFGLSAAVFAGTEDEALAVGSRIDAGGISINDAGVQSLTTEAEKHSFRFSGLGQSRMGPAGLMRFFRKKALMINRGAPRTIEHFREKP